MPLYCHSSTPHSSVFILMLVLSCIRTCDFRKKFASSNPRVAFFALEASVVFSERVVSENSRSSYSWRVFGLGRVISLMTA